MNSRCVNAAWLECFQEKPSWCRNEQVCQGRISVQRFERSNGLDTGLYKKHTFYIPLPYCFNSNICIYNRYLHRTSFSPIFVVSSRYELSASPALMELHCEGQGYTGSSQYRT